jgi:hypothetical protein
MGKIAFASLLVLQKMGDFPRRQVVILPKTQEIQPGFPKPFMEGNKDRHF